MIRISPWILLLPVLLAIIEHFIDTENFTSDDGVQSGPDEIIEGDPTGIAMRLQVLPISTGDRIYEPQDEADEMLLALRACAGTWGGHNGIDKSPPFAPKTGRYFRKLVDSPRLARGNGSEHRDG